MGGRSPWGPPMAGIGHGVHIMAIPFNNDDLNIFFQKIKNVEAYLHFWSLLERREVEQGECKRWELKVREKEGDGKRDSKIFEQEKEGDLNFFWFWVGRDISGMIYFLEIKNKNELKEG